MHADGKGQLDDRLHWFRSQVPVLKTRAYLFSGALNPCATPVRAAWNQWSEAWSSDPNAVYSHEATFGEMDRLRREFALLIGADDSEIALTDNTSRAANIAIRILEAKAKANSNVVVDDSTYPSSNYPWRAHGRVDVRHVRRVDGEDTLSAFARYVDSETIALCVSHVGPFSGVRHNLSELGLMAHAHGAVLMVDAAQSTGVLPIDVERDAIDVLVTTGMKWLLGPPGIGYLYISRELLQDAPILDVGYVGLDVDASGWSADRLPPVSAEAKRYELGLPALPALAASRAGINLIQTVGPDRIAGHVEGLVGQCISGLAERGANVVTPMDPRLRAGVIVCNCSRPNALFGACRDEGVDIGVLPHAIRIDPHGFNNSQDIERFLDSYDRFLRNEAKSG
jgi:selenocysteine lyase/cysteine desulfurase